MAPPYLIFTSQSGLAPRVRRHHTPPGGTDESPVLAPTPTPTLAISSSGPAVSTSTSFVFVAEATTTSQPTTSTQFTRATLPAQASNALTTQSASRLTNGDIVGIAVGGFAFLIFILILAVLLWRYKRRQEAREIKYTPWSRINSGSSSSDSQTGTLITGRRSNAVSENATIEIPIPTPYLFDSPVSLHARSHPFRASPTTDARKLLKSLVPHDYPVPRLPTQQPLSPTYYSGNVTHSPMVPNNAGMPIIHITASSNSSPSIYGSEPDLDELSHKAVDQQHTAFVKRPAPRPLPVPLPLRPAYSSWQSPRDPVIDSSSRYSQTPVINRPPAAVTRSRSREVRAIAELIKAIESPSSDPQKRLSMPSSKHSSTRSERDDSVGIAVTTPFAYPSPYRVGTPSAQSSMTNMTLRRLTDGFPLPPEMGSSNFSTNR